MIVRYPTLLHIRALLVLMFGIFLLASFKGEASESSPPKILHITLHKGCKKELEGVAKTLGLNLETLFVHDMEPLAFDGTSQGSALYNIGHDRAQRIWDLHKDYFSSFDVIITSDTAPLSRVFLQNGWNKPLIIWICNRFDYCDIGSLDCNFPDGEYYELLRSARKMGNVKFIAYTPFEHYYAKSKNINTGTLTITPCGFVDDKLTGSSIPADVIKEQTFFLPPYHNETVFMDLSSHLKKLGIPNFCGRYNGPADLKDFKGIICLPYSWSNLALFENLQLGMVYFIPSKKFFKQLATSGNYFHPNLSSLLHEKVFYLSEWYYPDRKEIFVYFDSWKDLIEKVQSTDFPVMKKKVKAYAKKHKKTMLSRWKKVFDELR